MTRWARLAWCVAVAALVLSNTRGAAGLAPSGDGAQADCSFSHPQLPGRCNLTIPLPRNSTPEHACDAVLRCLNSGACTQREKYCHNTGLVRDWKLEEAKVWTPPVQCGFSNPAYSGWCWRAVPVPAGFTPAQACQAVLACLNGSACEGFNQYCDAENQVRSGWRLEQVMGPERPATPKRGS
jgi:hypothetical protein